MRFIVSLLAFLFAMSAFSAGQRDTRISGRVIKGLGIEDDKFAELPVQSLPKDGFIVDTYQILPIDVSNGFYQIWDEVHLDETDGLVKLLRSDAESNALWQITLNDFSGTQRHPRMLNFPDGTLLTAWESASAGTNNVNIWCMRIDGEGNALWPLPGVLSCAPHNQKNVSLACLCDGGIAAVWEDYRNGDSDIYFQEILPDGSPVYTPDGVAIEKVEGAQLKPGFVLDEQGFAKKLCWEDHKDLNYPICMVTIDLDDLSVPEAGALPLLLSLLFLLRRKG